MKCIAIIPARSGSKGLKDKNIKEIKGFPLVWYSIQAALRSRCFEEVMVSTDSALYADIARKCGASVPFLRSRQLSTDEASSWDAVKEVLDYYLSIGTTFDCVALLQPTSPLRTAEDIINAFSILIDKEASSVVSVCEMDHSPLWSNVLPPNGSLKGFIKSELQENTARQGLPTYYRVNGAIYLSRISDFLGEDLYSDKGYAYIMPRERSVDIDTELDFKLAEFLLGERDVTEKNQNE